MSRRALPALLAIALLAAGGAWWLLREEARAPARELTALRAPDASERLRAPDVMLPGADIAPPAALDIAVSHDVTPATENAPRVQALLELLLLHADRQPAAGATVVLGRAGGVLARGTTDDDGRLELQPPAGDDGGQGEILVGGVSELPVRLPIAATIGPQTVVLPAGAVVEGRVLVDGAPPRAPLRLGVERGWDGEEEPDGVTRDACWEALRILVPGSNRGAGRNAQLVGTRGRFRFSALPDSVWRFLGTDDGFAWEADEAAADGFLPPVLGAAAAPSQDDCPFDAGRAVFTPAVGLVVRLRSLPQFSGRVVEADGRTPVPGALIDSLHTRGSGNSSSTHTPCDAEGRFVLMPMTGREPLASLTLRITHPERRGHRLLALGEDECARSTDFGDIVLDATRLLRLQVRDEQGAPITGAVAVGGTHTLRSPPTDANGRTELAILPSDPPSVLVGAHGYVEATVRLPPDRDGGSAAGDELVIVLSAAASLKVTVVREDGSEPEGLRLTLRSAHTLFEARAGHEGGHPLPGAQSVAPQPRVISYSLRQSDDRGSDRRWDWIRFPIPGAGTVGVSGLATGAPFELILHDPWGGFVHGPEALSLAPGEWRELRLVVSCESRDLVVAVRDPQGAPLQATVSVVDKLGQGSVHEWPTSEVGVATIPGLQGSGLALLVRSEGCVERTIEGVAAPADGTPLQVVLQLDR